MEIVSTRSNAILFWKVADGEVVEAGQVVASLEQGKGAKSVVSPCAGTVRIACKGGMVSEGQLLATVERC